jgi:hypothetical protein
MNTAVYTAVDLCAFRKLHTLNYDALEFLGNIEKTMSRNLLQNEGTVATYLPTRPAGVGPGVPSERYRVIPGY